MNPQDFRKQIEEESLAWANERIGHFKGFSTSSIMQVAYEAGARRSIKLVIEALRSEEATTYSFSKLEETRCSKNDSHLTRFDWAEWLESKFLKGEG